MKTLEGVLSTPVSSCSVVGSVKKLADIMGSFFQELVVIQLNSESIGYHLKRVVKDCFLPVSVRDHECPCFISSRLQRNQFVTNVLF